MIVIKREVGLVLGMHRSGTSATAKALVSFGFDAGDNLMPSSSDNVKGYWEDVDIINLNNEILSDLNFSWDQFEDINLNRFTFLLPEYYNKYKERAISIIKDKFKRKNRIMLKDPRFSILLPFWKKIFNEYNTKVYYILTIREPIEVAMSLKKRDKLSIKKGLYLWIYYNFLVLMNIESQIHVIDYEQLLKDPDNSLIRLANFCNVNFDENKQSINEFKTEFLDPKLRHHSDNKIIDDENKSLYETIFSFYLTLKDQTLKEIFTTQNIVSEFKFKFNNYFTEFNNINSQNDILQIELFIDNGNGFNSKNKECVYYIENTSKYIVNLKKYKLIKQIRLDPCDRSCFVILYSIELKSDEKKEIINNIYGNYYHSENNIYIFLNNDPQIIINNEMDDVNEIILNIKILTKIEMSNLLIPFFHFKLDSIKEKETELINEITNLIAKKDEINSQLTQVPLLINKINIILLQERKRFLKNNLIFIPFTKIKRLVGFFIHPRKTLLFNKMYNTIKKSDFYDEQYYLLNNPDLIVTCRDPLEHYIIHGWREGRKPSKKALNNITKIINSTQNEICTLYTYLMTLKDGKV